jgi:hypothetical protein
VQLEFFFRARDDIVRANDVRVNGAGENFKQTLRPCAIGRDHALAVRDSGGHDPVARRELGRQPTRNPETDDARGATINGGAKRRAQPRTLVAKNRHARTARYTRL